MRQSPWLAWVLLAPTFLILGLFVIYPALQSFNLSLRNVAPFSNEFNFVVLKNYTTLFSSPEYWHSLKVSVFFMLYTVVPSIILSLLAALALDSNPYVRGFFRTIFLMPVAISSAMAAMLWIFIYNPFAGYLNYVLDLMGIQGPNWLGDPKWALLAVSVTTIWKEIGFNVIFFLAGLSSVPPDLTESATLDGAGPLQRFRHITLPIISPTILFVTVVSVINSFQSFGQIHILTMGGPAGATNLLVYNLYRDAFVNFRSGVASSQAVVLFVIIMIFTIAQFFVAKRRVHYG
jgi:sn-glycerol 3-phosphate transport system permease protein